VDTYLLALIIIMNIAIIMNNNNHGSSIYIYIATGYLANMHHCEQTCADQAIVKFAVTARE
jgi:hypothetical protein